MSEIIHTLFNPLSNAVMTVLVGDTDAESQVHEAKTESVFVKFLHCLNVGKVPFMLVLSTIGGDKIGFAEFIIEQNPMKLNVKSHTGEEIAYGDRVMVTDESDDRKIYFVTKEITL